MSGRGRGRGKYTPPSGARLQLQKAAEDCGFDSRNLRSLQSRPDLFPDIELHSSGLPMRVVRQKQAEDGSANKVDDGKPVVLKGVKRSAATNKLIQKGREINHRIQNSAFYVRHTKDVPDVIRYSDSFSIAKAEDNSNVKGVMAHCLGGREQTNAGLFLPDELVYGPRILRKPGWGSNEGRDGKKLSLEELEAREKVRLRRLKLGLEVDDDEDKDNEFIDIVEQDIEEEDEGGYAVNHYDSDVESNGGDDEAVF